MLFNKVTVAGLGLIGGSLAWALRSSGKIGRVSGIDTDPGTIEYALGKGIIDEGPEDAAEAVSGAEVIVIATHVSAIADTVRSLMPLAPEGAIFTDTGSVKGSIVREIEGFLPSRLQFVGGHPIAGTESSGVMHSSPDLFRGKRCILTPTDKTALVVKGMAASLWELAGCEVHEMSVDTHDRVFGLVSHLPHVAAYSLVDTILSSEDPEMLFNFAGGGLRDYTRVASSSPSMWADILIANRDNVLEAIGGLKTSIDKIAAALKKNDRGALIGILSKAAKARRDRSG